MLRDYGLDSDATSASIREEVYLKKDNSGIERAIERDKAVLVAGHVPVTKYGSQLGLPNTIAFFRDPVQQVISHYRHAVRNQDYRGDLMSFARLDSVRNIQSRIMADIDPALLGVVGLTANYRDTLATIRHRWGWNLRQKKKNVSGRLHIRQFTITEEERSELARQNRSDQILYTRACQVFSNTWFCLERGIGTDPRGAITRANSRGELVGWAFDMLSDRPAEINVFINGVARTRARCELSVPDLEQWKITRNGHVGFKTEINNTENGDLIEVRDLVTGLTLATHFLNS